MSNLIYAKSFANTSGLTVDNISTTTINNITYNTNLSSDVSGYITNLYANQGLQNNYLNSLSGAIKTINNGTFGSITATSLNTNNVYCANYGSQGGNLSINSPFTLNLSTANSCSTNFYTVATYFNTNGGSLTCAINWGGTAQNGNYSMTVNGVVYAWGASLGSDDRIKGNEQYITNSTATLLKLRPQIYNKYNNFDCSGTFIRESGLIAQEIYYDAPELQHIVSYSKDATISGYITSSTDPSIDPDYSCWGSSPAGVSYTQLIPYLIKSIQELDARIKLLGG